MELATRAARRARLPGGAALTAAQAEHLLGEHGEVGLAPARLALQVDPLLLPLRDLALHLARVRVRVRVRVSVQLG